MLNCTHIFEILPSPPSGPDRAQIQQLNLKTPPNVWQKNQDRIKDVELYTHFLNCTPLPYGTLRTDDVEDTTLRTATLRTATLRTGDVEDRRRWGQATLWTNSSPKSFPNPGPEGPTETLQLTYILKCWQHISNKICSFPKQKPSKLHIFSKCWQHISNKTFIPQVLVSYIQYTQYVACPQCRLSSTLPVLNVACPQCRVSLMSLSSMSPVLNVP